jgi:hypothetical protein
MLTRICTDQKLKVAFDAHQSLESFHAQLPVVVALDKTMRVYLSEAYMLELLLNV